MSKLQESLASGKFTYTGEVGPPKGIDLHHVLEGAAMMTDKVAAINVTDLQTAVMRVGSLAVSAKLIDAGHEPVFQMVCRDRNRLALQSDLLSAAVMGVENVLAITGDHVVMGDHKDAMPVYDLDSVQLLKAIVNLESGSDLGFDFKGKPNKLEGDPPKFFKGCVVTPCSDLLDAQIMKLEKKVEAGAQFCQTQAVYDPAAFEAFMKRVEGIGIPIMVGIVVLKSAGMAKYMNGNVPGVIVPDGLIQTLSDAPKDGRKAASVKIAADLIREMKPMCQGAHIMPLGWDDVVTEIIDQVEG